MPITPREYLSKFAEKMPCWLANYKQGERVDASDFLKSRTVFYPGAGGDGHPFKVFGASHAAHCFVYADYGISKESFLATLANDSARKLLGYKLAVQQELTLQDLVSVSWSSNVDREEWSRASQDWVQFRGLSAIESFMSSSGEQPYWMTVCGVQPYGVLCIFDREMRYGNDHGPERLALIYLGADGIATYDALYCQTGCRSPFGLLLQDHGLGGNWNTFGRGGLMERIAIRTGVFPEWILSDRDEWTGFNRIPSVAGSRGGQNKQNRFLFSQSVVAVPVNSR